MPLKAPHFDISEILKDLQKNDNVGLTRNKSPTLILDR